MVTRTKHALYGLVVAVAFAAHVPEESSAAHQYADTVLFPRFTAAVNDWAQQHPGEPDHVKKMHAPDVKRLQLIRETFRDWNEEMKRAGY